MVVARCCFVLLVFACCCFLVLLVVLILVLVLVLVLVLGLLLLLLLVVVVVPFLVLGGGRGHRRGSGVLDSSSQVRCIKAFFFLDSMMVDAQVYATLPYPCTCSQQVRRQKKTNVKDSLPLHFRDSGF